MKIGQSTRILVKPPGAGSGVQPDSADNIGLYDGLSPTEEWLGGVLSMRESLCGIGLQCCDHQAFEHRRVTTTLPPGLIMIYLAKGTVHFTLDKTPFKLSAMAGPPEGLAVHLATPTAFTQTLAPGLHIEKLVVTLPPSLIDKVVGNGGAAVAQLRQQHLGAHRWRICDEQLTLSRHTLQNAARHSGASALLVEANVLRLVHLAFCALFPNMERSRPSSARTTVDAAQIMQQINALVMAGHSAADSGLIELAAKLNMSTSKLQRTFKQQFGTTVMEYIRMHRLRNAKDAMLHEGMSIGEAAFSAGYKHSSNFCSAFKKAFGYCPGEIKART